MFEHNLNDTIYVDNFSKAILKLKCGKATCLKLIMFVTRISKVHKMYCCLSITSCLTKFSIPGLYPNHGFLVKLFQFLKTRETYKTLRTIDPLHV